MNTLVKEKLQRIRELFPSERVEKSKQRLERLWQHRFPDDRYPFRYGSHYRLYWHDGQTKEERLMLELDEALFHGMLNDDYIPSLFTGTRVATTPNMFGAHELICENDYGTDKMLFSVEDIFNLPDPVIREDSIAAEWLRRQRYFLEETEGLLPLHPTDVQGHMDIAGQLCSYDDLFLFASDDPDAIHFLLDKINAAFVMLWKAQQELIGDLFIPSHLFPHSWAPPDAGCSLSADSLVMFGPDFYGEFFEPVLKKTAAALGPISIHSCGQFPQHLKTLSEADYISAVNPAQMTFKSVLEAGFNSRKLLLMNSVPLAELKETFRLIRENKLLVNLMVDLPFPQDGKGFKLPWEWSKAEHQTLLEQEKDVMELAWDAVTHNSLNG